MDKIIFRGMEFYAYHGVFKEEQQLGQIYEVDVEVYLDLKRAGQSDQLQDTLNYADLFQLIEQLMTEETYQLIEAVAEQIAARILNTFLQVTQIKVQVNKPHPPIPGHYAGVAVEITRERNDGRLQQK